MASASATSGTDGDAITAVAPGGFGIRGRLLLLVLIALLPLLALIVYTAEGEIKQERGNELERAHTQARLIARDLDVQMKSIEDLLVRLAPRISLAPGTAAHNEAVVRAVAAVLPPLFLNLEVRGLNGEALVVTAAREFARDLADVSAQKYFQETLARRAFTVGEPVNWEKRGLWTVTFGYPLVREDGSVVGALGATIDLMALRAVFDGRDVPPGTLMTVLNSNRVVITRASNPEQGIAGRRPAGPIIDLVLATHEGSREYRAPDGMRRVAGFSTCARAPWTAFVRMPTDAAYAAAERGFREALIVGALTLAVSLGLAWIIAHRITAPLRQLAAEATLVGDGGQMPRSQVRSGGELGQLARGFNVMLAKLEERDAELRRRVEELQVLFDLMPVGIAIAVDATGRDIRMNRMLAGIFGLPPKSNASLTAPAGEAPCTYRVRRHGKWLSAAELPIQRAILEDKPVTDFEHTIVRADGVEVDVLLSAVPLHDGEGRVSGCVATFQDLTLRKQAERERLSFERKLLETQKLESLGVLAGGIAHDFNNLLTGILGNASLVSMDLPPHSEAQKNLGYIRDGSMRAAELCQQMLAYSGKGRFVVQKIDINRCVEETIHLLKISIGKSVKLTFNLRPGLPAIEADVTQIRQVVMNLVINASEAIGAREGAITISTSYARLDRVYLANVLLASELPAGDFVVLEISDNGCGMSAETQAKIFEPFFTTKFSGRGLGLAAVLGIVRGHQGALKVYSEPGHGTTFKLLFPAASGSAAPFPPDGPAQVEWRGQGCVLIVDDEEAVRATTEMVVRRLGFDVVLAADGVEALEVFRASPDRFALVVMDLTMPRLNGDKTFIELRRLKPDVRVVMMSGFSEQEAVTRFTGVGFAGFVQKPFQFAALSHALRTALEVKP